MSKLRKAISFETTFGNYSVDELLGEGGAGRVYGGVSLADSSAVAIKVLAQDRATTDKRHRFKNEVAFLARNKHTNIVSVIDHGIAISGEIIGPFYVMRRYDGNLRDVMRTGIPTEDVLLLFRQILDGVEAAHLQKVIHRDLKPENILQEGGTLAIADFGIAHFTDGLVTTVETVPGQRLANFQYAAPEQRTPGKQVTELADIYALGLILNEMFTGAIPLGTDYQLIAPVSPQSGFLDNIVARMLRQTPDERPRSVAEVKGLIQHYKAEAVSLQRLSEIDGTVIKASEIDEPLAETPPKLLRIEFDRGQLTLILDRPVTPQWINAFQRMGQLSYVQGFHPAVFVFSGTEARVQVQVQEYQVQLIVDHFKSWLPTASQTLKGMLEQDAKNQEAARKEALRREREAEEQRLRILRNTRI